MFKKADLKYIFLVLFLLVSAGLADVFHNLIIHWIRNFFEFSELNLYAGGLATIITILHKIKTRKFIFSPTMSFNDFKIPLEELLSFISNPITLVCSLSLAKGLFLQISEHVLGL